MTDPKVAAIAKRERLTPTMVSHMTYGIGGMNLRTADGLKARGLVSERVTDAGWSEFRLTEKGTALQRELKIAEGYSVEG